MCHYTKYYKLGGKKLLHEHNDGRVIVSLSSMEFQDSQETSNIKVSVNFVSNCFTIFLLGISGEEKYVIGSRWWSLYPPYFPLLWGLAWEPSDRSWIVKGRRRRNVTGGQTGGESKFKNRAGKWAVRGNGNGPHLLGSGRAALWLLRAPSLKVLTGVSQKVRYVPYPTRFVLSWLERSMFICLRSLFREFGIPLRYQHSSFPETNSFLAGYSLK